MDFIKPNPVHCPSLAIRQDNGFANKLGLGMIKFGKDRGRARFSDSHMNLGALFGVWNGPRRT
jgi:hypothetical protein